MGHLAPQSCCNSTLRMTAVEAHRWAQVAMQRGTAAYAEWGSGGSTEALAWHSRHVAHRMRGVAIDSSQQWLDALRQRSPAIRDAEGAGALRLAAADVGPVRDWGVPVDWDARPPAVQRAQALRYVAAPALATLAPFDAMFVDGRFRAACALHALLLLKPNGTTLIHDFFEPGETTARIRREGYKVVLPWYHVSRVGRGTLAEGRPRAHPSTWPPEVKQRHARAFNAALHDWK